MLTNAFLNLFTSALYIPAALLTVYAITPDERTSHWPRIIVATFIVAMVFIILPSHDPLTDNTPSVIANIWEVLQNVNGSSTNSTSNSALTQRPDEYKRFPSDALDVFMSILGIVIKVVDS